MSLAVADSDEDGVPDRRDRCFGTAPGAAVNFHGCSLDQLVPCEGPRPGTIWKSHRRYIQAFVRTAREFHKNGFLTRPELRAFILKAKESNCGDLAQ